MASNRRSPRDGRGRGPLLAVGLAVIFLSAGSWRCQRSPPVSPQTKTGLPAADDVAGASRASARWIVDPRVPGPSLPSVGRSLFDHLSFDRDQGRLDVPFPFRALVARLEGQLAAPGRDRPVKSVLIPRGRSLQRDAGAPEFFKYPRAVVAADGEPAVRPGRSGMLLKDRLYLGYHEKAAVVEVISYNEAAGRFEFQVVKDYRAGGTPRVLYANRNLCMACHQNGGPVFARQLWDETNANPDIAALLRQERRDFYGLPVEQGVDVPYEVDNATDRANRFSAYQLLWREGCGPPQDAAATTCRADLFTLALQYRLGGGVTLDRRSARYRRTIREHLPRRWRSQWPHGLLLPDPDVPNRVPLRPAPFADSSPTRAQATLAVATRASLVELVRQSDVPSAFEPLLPRAPLAVWDEPAAGSGVLERLAAGLGEFLAEEDVRRLDEHLAARAPAARGRLASACDVELDPRDDGTTRISFTCPAPSATSDAPGDGAAFAMVGRVYVRGGRVVDGSIDSVSVDGVSEVPALIVSGGTVIREGVRGRATFAVRQRASGRRPRRASGHRIEGLSLVWTGAAGPAASERPLPGRAELTTLDDFAAVEQAVEAMAAEDTEDVFGDQPFRRASLLRALEARLGAPPREWCCVDSRNLPPPVLDEHDVRGERAAVPADERMRALQRYCARCHETPDRFPPNFLHGSAAEVEAKVAQCAERILYRVSMWGLLAEDRPKTPMPPESALTALHVSPAEWPSHPDLERVREYAAYELRTRQGRAPTLAELSARGYANLETCLAEAPRLVGAVR